MTESNQEMIIVFDPEKCTQCMGCESACKSWRKVPYGIKFRRVFNLWNGNYPIVKNSSLSLNCLHCVQPACAEACPVEAIVKDERSGLVEVDATLCIGCESCADACPYGIPQFNNEGTMMKCDLCLDRLAGEVMPPCVETCPGHALTLVNISSSEKSLYEEQVANLLKGENRA